VNTGAPFYHFSQRTMTSGITGRRNIDISLNDIYYAVILLYEPTEKTTETQEAQEQEYIYYSLLLKTRGDFLVKDEFIDVNEGRVVITGFEKNLVDESRTPTIVVCNKYRTKSEHKETGEVKCAPVFELFDKAKKFDTTTYGFYDENQKQKALNYIVFSDDKDIKKYYVGIMPQKESQGFFKKTNVNLLKMTGAEIARNRRTWNQKFSSKIFQQTEEKTDLYQNFLESFVLSDKNELKLLNNSPFSLNPTNTAMLAKWKIDLENQINQLVKTEETAGGGKLKTSKHKKKNLVSKKNRLKNKLKHTEVKTKQESPAKKTNLKKTHLNKYKKVKQ